MSAPANITADNGRKHGGRKLGAATRLNRSKANELCASGKSPLDIMVNNMIFWFDHAKSLTDQVDAAVIQFTPDGVAADPEMVGNLTKLLKQMLAARENAQKCAVDAAPYCHPRLASITLTPEAPAPERAAAKLGLTAKEAAERYATRLRTSVAD